MHRRKKSRAHPRYLAVHDDFAGTAPRLNRLPQRLDYTLIPAPLDLSAPLVDEKAELPAIIVTPSSPVFESEFFIAFLAPPPSPTFSQRLASMMPTLPSGSVRTIILLFVLLFIMASHLVMHRIATNHPHLDFDVTPEHDIALGVATLSRPADMDMSSARMDAHDVDPEESNPSTAGWFDLHALWAPVPATNTRSPKDFVVVEPSPSAPAQSNDNDNAEDRPQAAA
ncbi:hypothetical protein GY45DRAFT_1397723 [Cubamyces sp. BRFM 1775]|nr:hypothetical protein GY45DRAFT_1397723 [Cubamyces sp. BRFM 1775]